MTPIPEKSQAWIRQRKTPSQSPFWEESLLGRVSSEVLKVSGVSEVEVSLSDLELLAMAMTMMQAKDESIAMSSTGLTRSLLKMKPRIADQRGFVWKMIKIKVIGIKFKLNVKSKKPIFPHRERS